MKARTYLVVLLNRSLGINSIAFTSLIGKNLVSITIMEKKENFKHKNCILEIYLAILLDSSIIFLANDYTDFGEPIR